MNNCIKCVVAAILFLAATGCTKNSESTPEEKFKDNFNALVMGGKTIDPYQDWNTTGSVSVRISVDLDNTGDYTVYLLQTTPIFDSEALWLGMARLKSGESKTVRIAKPANAGLLYAACFDSEGHAICKPVPIEAETEVTFSGKSPEQAQAYSSEGNPWNVVIEELPDLSEYTTGTLVEANIQDFEMNDDDPVHFKVSSDYTGFIASLGTYRNKSVYVTATWTLSFNQRVSGGNVLIVGNGGKLVVPKDFRLTTNPFIDEGAGMIYVLPGGEISGEGIVEFTTNEGTFSYNGGTITAKTLRLNGCTLYNVGTVGDVSNPITEVTCAYDEGGVIGRLVNTGTAGLAKITGENLALENAGYLKVNGELVLNGLSKMDDGSYTECNALTLKGSSDGDKLLYMGNAAYLNCLGDISIDNFGIWGPSGDDFKANAVVQFNNCTYCATTDGVAGTYLLDHVELIVPDNFPTVFDKGAMNIYDGDVKGVGIGKLQESFSGYYDLYMLYYWMNGYQGKILDASNYEWSLVTGKYNFLWKSSIAKAAVNVGTDRQTCFYSTSPSFDYSSASGFKKKATGSEPKCTYIYYIFETLESNTKDFDYNDVVLRVNMPEDNGDGTYKTSVQLMCVGNTTYTVVYHGGAPLGEEVHAAMGISTETTINTTNYSRTYRKLGELTFTDGDIRIDQLDFALQVGEVEEAEEGTTTVELEKQPTTLGQAPLYIVVNGNTKGKWFWATEGTNIGLAYPLFSTWASALQTAVDWYDNSNASSKVVTY